MYIFSSKMLIIHITVFGSEIFQTKNYYLYSTESSISQILSKHIYHYDLYANRHICVFKIKTSFTKGIFIIITNDISHYVKLMLIPTHRIDYTVSKEWNSPYRIGTTSVKDYWVSRICMQTSDVVESFWTSWKISFLYLSSLSLSATISFLTSVRLSGEVMNLFRLVTGGCLVYI